MGKCETLQFMPAFFSFFGVKLDPWTSFLFRASGKSHLSSGFLPRSLHPQDVLFQLLYLPSLGDFILDERKTLVRRLNSILPLQIAIINHEMLFPRFDFPNNVCLSTESVAVHTHRSHTFSGTVHYVEDAWSKPDDLWPSCAWDLQQESWSLDYHVPLWGLFDHIPWVFTTGFNQCEVMSPSTMKYLPNDNLLLLLVKQWH